MIDFIVDGVRAIKGSVIAFGVVLGLGLLSMGFLGIGIYYPVAPLLNLKFPGLKEWHGDWVWPATIGAGMAWSFGFLVAGWVNHHLLSPQMPSALRSLIYVGILWLWALILWLVILLANVGGRR